MLALEGVGNAFAIPEQPVALYWLAAKCLLIVGLLRGWVIVYGLFLAIALIHVVYFLPIQPIVSLLNFLMVCLAASARKFYTDRAFG